MAVDFVHLLENKYPGLFEKINNEITEERVFKYLKIISDTPAPFQTVTDTRALALSKILESEGYLANKNIKYIRNYENTGNAVILVGENDAKKQVWLMAHMDIITYLVEKQIDENEYLLTPICYHLAETGNRKAIVLGYDIEKTSYYVVSEGEFIFKGENSDHIGFQIIYKPNKISKIKPGMRVCFESELTLNQEKGEVQGSLDDAVGVTAIVLATCFLSKYNISVMCGLTDEEEGLSGQGSQSMCRGGARLLRYFDQPDLVIVCDMHEPIKSSGTGLADFKPGMGASFSEKSSNGIGEITPPILYEIIYHLSVDLKKRGIYLNENIGGYVSRSEGINALLRTQMVSQIGFLGRNRHFQQGFEVGYINDFVNLSKSIICLSLLTTTDLWRKMGLNYEH